MDTTDMTRIEGAAPRKAYLIVQKGAARIEVVELFAGGQVMVGRASSNRVIIPDGKASRQHCEFFWRGGDWYLRDLDSRNGVLVDGVRIHSDHAMVLGESVEIGSYRLVYTDIHPGEESAPSRNDGSFQIIERKSGTQFDRQSAGMRRMTKGQEGATDLFYIARAMSTATDIATLSRSVIDALMVKTSAEVGGILLLPSDNAAPDADQLTLAAFSGNSEDTLFSRFLSRICLDDRDAILAHDVSRHSQLGTQESLRELSVDSAVCAPIRHQGEVLGVIHLYTSRSEDPLSQHDLEFTLAVADQMGSQVHSFQLAEGLDKARFQMAELQDQLAVESELIGQGKVLDQLRRQIARVSPTDATVLIRGESGVGKELVARALHLNSTRRAGPFVCVNCAALTESLLESELFGHEKGAFTGASAARAGKFEQAHGGTLFLDEIGEMSPEIQAKFLRVLEGQAFERVGGGKSIEVDVRVVTATNRNLEDAVRAGKFRGDLFFRLQVIEIRVPALREHPEDVPAIAQHFVDRFSRKSARKIRGLAPAAVRKLQEHDWPGNVRELRNVVERAVILAEGDVLHPQDIVLTRLRLTEHTEAPLNPAQPVVLAVSATASAPAVVSEEKSEGLETLIDPRGDLWGSFAQKSFSLDDVDKLYIEAVLEQCAWNKSAAARVLQIERTTLDRRLKKYRLRRPGDDETLDGSEDFDDTEE